MITSSIDIGKPSCDLMLPIPDLPLLEPCSPLPSVRGDNRMLGGRSCLLA